MAREIEQVSYFKIEVPYAASKLRQLIEQGGAAIEGPWDGEEAITLIPDLDAGATGSITGGAYADLVGRIMHDHHDGDREAALAGYERSLPLINYENRQCGLLAAKSLMRESVRRENGESNPRFRRGKPGEVLPGQPSYLTVKAYGTRA